MVLHTGDWKLDSDPLTGEVTDEGAIRKLGDEGLLAMVCDSTNVFVDGEAGSEAEVRETLTPLIASLKGKVAAACFASNVARLQTLLRKWFYLLPFNQSIFQPRGCSRAAVVVTVVA